MKWFTAFLVILAFSVQAQAVTIKQYLLLSQQKPVLAQAYTAGVLDATKDAVWCSDQEPNLPNVVSAVRDVVINKPVDPDTPADHIIILLLVAAAPCSNNSNI